MLIMKKKKQPNPKVLLVDSILFVWNEFGVLNFTDIRNLKK